MLTHFSALLIGKSLIVAIFFIQRPVSKGDRPHTFMVKVHETPSPYPERMLIVGIALSPYIESHFFGCRKDVYMACCLPSLLRIDAPPLDDNENEARHLAMSGASLVFIHVARCVGSRHGSREPTH